MTNDQMVYETLCFTKIPFARETWGPTACLPPLPYGVYESVPASFFCDDDTIRLPKYRATVHCAPGRSRELQEAVCEVVSTIGTYTLTPATYGHEDGEAVFSVDFTLRRPAR